jgi:hypothetical protein
VKKSLVYLLASIFLLATAISYAGDTKESTSSDKTTENPHANCPMMQKSSAEAGAVTAADPASATADKNKAAAECPMTKKASEQTSKGSVELNSAAAESAPKADPATVTGAAAPKVAESCPDVTGKAALSDFHEIMSPMHMAFEDDKYGEMKSYMPRLVEASKELASYKCPNSDKCPPDCIKKFDEKKAALLKGVGDLDLAFKSDDNKKIDSAFMTMHQAFVDFAGMCNLPTKDTETKDTGAKTMDVKAVETESK